MKTREEKQAIKDSKFKKKLEKWNSKHPPARILQNVVIVGQDSKAKTGSTIARGAVGGAVFGVVGLVGGAASAKREQQVTLLLQYSDGSNDTEVVKVGSERYNQLTKYVGGTH